MQHVKIEPKCPTLLRMVLGHRAYVTKSASRMSVNLKTSNYVQFEVEGNKPGL
jgi:hypothetical protein